MPKSKTKKEIDSYSSPSMVEPANEVENREIPAEKTGKFSDPEDAFINERNVLCQNSEITETEIDTWVHELIDHFNSLPQEPDERILNIIEKQTEVLQKKTENFELQHQNFEVADKKFQLAKKALRKAKDHKLDSEKIDLIKFEKQQAKIERKQIKRLLKQEKQNLKNIRKIIRLLELTH